MSQHDFDYQSLLLQAKKKIDNYQAEIKALKKHRHNEPIAIVGISCQFPGANNHQEFWNNLQQGLVNLTHLQDQTRWSFADFYSKTPGQRGKMYSPKAGLIENVDQFDAILFNLAPREVEDMDPQQRLLLMATWNLFEGAGYAPYDLPSKKIGVFVGMMNRDYAQLLKGPDAITEYSGTGCAFSIAAGRISHIFGFTGPSIAIDTACSSSLVAVHEACLSLRMQECDMAIAGGVNVLLSPEAFIGSCQAGMLSPTGECRAFDVDANGYVRAEGCGLVLLKSLSQAQKDQNTIFAILEGSAINHDGRSIGLTVPNVNAQKQVMQSALAAAQIGADEIDCLETHGTGTKLGDPIESQSIGAIYGSNNRKKPLYIGSVKANIGHAESAAGIASLIKVILALYHGYFPPQPLFNSINPLCEFNQNLIVLPRELVKLPKGKIRAGVNAFSFCGTNIHIIVANHEETNSSSATDLDEEVVTLLTLSAATPAALETLHLLYANYLTQSTTTLQQIGANSQLTRSHLLYRSAILCNTRNEAIVALTHFKVDTHLPQQKQQHIFLFKTYTQNEIIDILQSLRSFQQKTPSFTTLLDSINILFKQHTGHCLQILLNATNEYMNVFSENIGSMFCILIQYILAQLWESWGILPHKIIMTDDKSLWAALLFCNVLCLNDMIEIFAANFKDYAKIHSIIKNNWHKLKYPVFFGDTLITDPDNITAFFKQNIQVNDKDTPLITYINLLSTTSSADILSIIQKSYLSGTKINWQNYYKNQQIYKIELPTYPFDLKSFWLPLSRSYYGRSMISEKKYLGLGIKLEVPGTIEFFSKQLSTITDPFLQEHHVFAETIFPAAAYIAMSISLLNYCAENSLSWQIANLNFLQPLVLNDCALTLVTQYTFNENDKSSFSLFAKPEGNTAAEFIQYMTGQFIKTQPLNFEPPHFKGNWQSYEVSKFYAELASRGLNYGLAFQKLATIEYTDKIAKGCFVNADISLTRYDFSGLAGLLDAGFQLIAILNHLKQDHTVYLPAAIAKISIQNWSQPITQVLVYSNNSQHSNRKDFNLIYQNHVGMPILIIESFTARAATRPSQHNKLSMYYTLGWQRWDSNLQSIDLAKIKVEQTPIIHKLKDIQQSMQLQEWEQSIKNILPTAAMKILLDCSLVENGYLSQNSLHQLQNQSNIHKGILTTLLNILVEQNKILKVAQGYQLIDYDMHAVKEYNIDIIEKMLVAQFPEKYAETHLLCYCLSRISKVLLGQLRHTEILFNDEAGLQAVYANAISASLLNQQILQTIQYCLKHTDKKQSLVILEVGAGTGGTSQILLDQLDKTRVNYIFSDISPTLVTKAQQQFQDYHDMKFLVLDISKDLVMQGIAENSIDIIIAANVIHATPIIADTLKFLHQSLKEGGLLLLRELVQPAYWLDMVFGLTQEWWGAKDDIRTGQPLLSLDKWNTVFTATDFEQHMVLSSLNTCHETVILAKREKIIPDNPTPKHWIVKDHGCTAYDFFIDNIMKNDTMILSYAQLSQKNITITNIPEHVFVLLPNVMPSTTDPTTFVEQILKIYHAIFLLLQYIIKLNYDFLNLKITLLCQNCFYVLPGDNVGNFSMSLFQGMIKSLIHEHPNFTIRMIEIGPTTTKQQFYQALYLCHDPVMSCRFLAIYTQKLLSYLPTENNAPIHFDSKASYLILGGMGGLGKLTTTWLLAKGIKNIILAGRRESTIEIQEYCDSLSTTYHARVIYYSFDTSDLQQFNAFVDNLHKMPKVKSVIDTVGILNDGFLHNQSWTNYKSVLQIKIATAWFLHCYFTDVQDFILFSSAAALFGSPGQTNHSAANAFLDGLSIYRQSLGLSGLSLNWGAWSKIGAASAKNVELRYVNYNVGVEVISPELGLESLETVYKQQSSQIGIIPINWDKYASYVPVTMRNYFSEFVMRNQLIKNKSVTNHSESNWIIILKSKLESRRQNALINLILLEVQQLLLLDTTQEIPVDKNFFEIGMDSLTAVQLADILKHKLSGLEMPTTLIFDYPNLSALSHCLLVHYLEHEFVNMHV